MVAGNFRFSGKLPFPGGQPVTGQQPNLPMPSGRFPAPERRNTATTDQAALRKVRVADRSSGAVPCWADGALARRLHAGSTGIQDTPEDAEDVTLLCLDRTDQRRPHRTGQPEKDHRTVTTEAGGQGLVRYVLEAFVRPIPVIGDPDVSGGIDIDIRNDLQSADVAHRAVKSDRRS